MLEKMSEMIAEQLIVMQQELLLKLLSRMILAQIHLTCLSWLWLWKMNTILRSRLKILQI